MSACWDVPVISQRTENLCWEACSRTLWYWRYRSMSTADRDSSYRRSGGSYLTLDRGLTETEMDNFYRGLGLRSKRAPTGADMRGALRNGPVIFNSIHGTRGHAMVAAYYTDSRRSYQVINPCGVEAVNFGDDGSSAASCTASSVERAASDVDPNLGQFIWYW
jgi:hypothetical protein